MELLVTPEWLAAELGAPDLVVLDATVFLPAHGRDARAEFEAGHVPGARFMDLSRFAPLPEPGRLSTMPGELCVGQGTRAVVYDDSPLRSAARGWWLLAHAGVDAAVLDGGLAGWRARVPPRDGEGDRQPQAGGGGGPPSREVGDAERAQAWAPATTPLRDDEQVRTAPGGSKPPREAGDLLIPLPVPGRISQPDILACALPIADARPPARFRGEEPEPRAGVAPGHIPGARNLHYDGLFNPDGTYKQADDLRAAFAAAGVDPARPFVATCGSGVTAASLVFAARLLGNADVPLYDGSWAEWGADPSTPKATGPA